MKPKRSTWKPWTPAQHRLWARILREEPELDPDSQELATMHEQLARAFELAALEPLQEFLKLRAKKAR